MKDIARRELVHLSRLCAMGTATEWEFNEWHHGVTGRPMGKAFQAWSAASFIKACHSLHMDPDSLEHDL
jgi:glycogen debranching enzyme